MIDFYNETIYINNKNKIIIHSQFPKKQLVEIMRPYLSLYFSYKYSLINTTKMNSKLLLYEKLKQFYNFNPFFGRKQIIVQPFFSINGNKEYRNVYTYNDKHINFNIENNNFLTSHLSDKNNT